MVEINNTTSDRRTRSDGFSLIEVAIVLLILGILIVPAIYLYNIGIQTQRHSQKEASIKAATMALTKYALLHGRYPIPADPGIAMGAPTFGHSAPIPAGGPPPPWPDCQLGTTAANEVCRTTANTYLGRSVLIGVLPFAELNVPLNSVIDPDKNLITYAITESMTDTTTYNESGGGVIVLNSVGAQIYAGASSRSHFAVVINGDDRAGAYAQNGSQPIACPGASLDSENCDRDGTFRSNIIPGTISIQINEGNTANHFDDYVGEKNSSTSGIWSYLPDPLATDLSIRDRVGGNVAIGNCDNIVPCVPKSRLDVYGDGSATVPAVRADEIKTKRLCFRGTSTGDVAGNGPYSCVDDYSLASNVNGADQTVCLGGVCPPVATSWNSTNLPPWFVPEIITGDPTFGGTGLSEGNDYWMSTAGGHSSFHRGNGIYCVNGRALNGMFDYDETCNDTSYVSAASVTSLGTCAASGEYARGITAAGTLLCQTPAANH
ncbi:MAG TPA: prepilin-type N-terminal cleavage/methylation domain-containing protein [Alphaproteobacteria bacterium]|nr:prepilin-type N-terminal cleavage/methylation domain-containing protein [Alphaproteobacteria bacterium]